MHGLVNRSIQRFVEETYGAEAWRPVAEGLGLGDDGFDFMRVYDDALTERALAQVAARLGKPCEAVLEDMGTWLVADRSNEGVRRLLRFSGDSFCEFLRALDELPGRVRLALPDLRLPALVVRDRGGGGFGLQIGPGWPGLAPVMVGMLRAMADDYGALVVLEAAATPDGGAEIDLRVLDSAFTPGRSFSLAGPCLRVEP